VTFITPMDTTPAGSKEKAKGEENRQ